ncbi:conserved hypothetical protein [Nitrosopumilaceae archaeon]|nr:conserved hypothetical protein [Nitrosopumilaceae archaeon]
MYKRQGGAVRWGAPAPFLSGPAGRPPVNSRFIIVGVVLGAIVAAAVIIGAPGLGGFDSLR